MNKTIMKRLGSSLLPVGFLVAAYVTVQHPNKVQWSYWLLATMVTALGALLLRLSQRVSAEDSAAMADDIGVIEQSLDTLVARVSQMNADKSESNVFTYCSR
ncbi:MAG TPA: hypothetical protein ENK23_03560, partial [Sorangium sp.]|nr:hypothetical protein [Sorangium sp.]